MYIYTHISIYLSIFPSIHLYIYILTEGRPPLCSQPDFKYTKQSPCISSDKGTSWTKDKGMEIGGKVVQ